MLHYHFFRPVRVLLTLGLSFGALYKHFTTAPMVKIDGVEEEHTKVKSNDEAAVKNLARYILSR